MPGKSIDYAKIAEHVAGRLCGFTLSNTDVMNENGHLPSSGTFTLSRAARHRIVSIMLSSLPEPPHQPCVVCRRETGVTYDHDGVGHHRKWGTHSTSTPMCKVCQRAIATQGGGNDAG